MPLDKNYNASEVESRVQKFWSEDKIFRFDAKSKKPLYTIDTPPPTISGEIHVGHAYSYSHAEFIARYKRMRGFSVFFPMGFDDNGLPSERYVEKQLGIRAIDLERKEFIKLCLQETKKGGENFRKVWESLGISVDWSLLYSTINEMCQRISQRSFIELYRKGLTYRKEAPATWCPHCQTAVAQAELEDVQRKTHLNTIYFNLRDSKEKIKIATTRPELLPACVAVFVNPHDERYKSLIGKFAVVPIFGQEVPITSDEKVDPEFGTGVVMVCTFGDKTDIEWWQKYNLPLKSVIDKRGRLTEEEFKGLNIEEARKKTITVLKDKKELIEQKELEQSVNVHERCGTPVEFYVSLQWYVRILDSKEKWLELGDKINWYPEHMRIRYKQWVEGLNMDWAISRQRYFGVPFPVWFCKKCGSIILAEESRLPVDPLKDVPKQKCKCGSKEFVPDRDVMDTWTTSALTPLINMRWKEKDENKNIYPMSLRPQAHDIIRTWAFYTIAKCYMHTEKIPWKNIMISGHALDPHGKKMSKSKGNIVDPLKMKEKYSADALRFWATSAKLGEDIPFQEKDVATGQKLVNKLWNVAKFSEQFMNETKKPKKLNIVDEWILSKLMRVVEASTNGFEEYEYSKARNETNNFFWFFTDNYLEFVKHRAYAGDKSAKWTLRKCLLTILKLYAPIIPHITEEIYQKLYQKTEKETSIHISDWPQTEKDIMNKNSEKVGDALQNVIAQIRQIKHDNKLALNWRIESLEIECPAEIHRLLEIIEDEIKGAMNIDKIVFSKGKVLKLNTRFAKA